MVDVTAEFQFLERRTFDGVLWHVGTVCSGTVRRGDHFRELRRIDSFRTAEHGRYRIVFREQRPIELRVLRISVFNLFPDECDAGYHCSLELEGDGAAALEDARFQVEPCSYDLLVISRS